MNKNLKESDLFEPLKSYFEENGYKGDGEVGSIDLYLEKDGYTTAVELKKTLDFKSVQQAALDQKTCDFVYIGIFRPRDLYSGSGRDKLYILKRLGIGLICVSPKSGLIEVVCEPFVSEISNFQKYHKDKTESLKNEFRNRRIKSNTGGVNKTRLITAYKEESLLVLFYMVKLGGTAKSGEICKLTDNKNATRILYNNFNGWFDKLGKGLYSVNQNGLQALEEYGDVISKLVPDDN